jgi:t-SNARE complex subunit (syntaxin)
MSRLSPCLLLTFFALTALCGSAGFAAEPLSAPSAVALPSDDHAREVDKYNRKLERLELKRARDMQKIEADYLKLLQRKKSMDLRKLQERLDKFQLKQKKLDKKYRKELEKLERERERKGL